MNNINKKGFSLSELLVVIAIIAILTIIAIPSIITINKNINKRMYKEKQNKIVAAAELYATNNPDIFNGKEVIQLPVSELLKNDYLKQDVPLGDSSCKDNSSTGSNGANGCILNPIDNTSINSKIVTIRKKAIGVVAEFGENTEENVQSDTLVKRVCNSIKKGTITGKWGTNDTDTCECKFDSSGNVTGIYKTGTNTKVNACIIGGSNPDNWLSYGRVEWRVLGLYDINNDGTKLSAKIITNGTVDVNLSGDDGNGGEDTCNLTPVSFEEDEWCTIINAVRTGNTSKYKVGDTKTIDMDKYGIRTIRIANMSTPSDCSKSTFSQTACGFVLEFADIVTTHYMNATYTNVGGWPVTKVRKFINKDIYELFPIILQDAILNTKVISLNGEDDKSKFTTTDKLYLLSPTEVYSDWSSSTYIAAEYDTTKNLTRILDYYKDKGITTTNYSGAIKKNGTTASDWWLRDAEPINNNAFVSVSRRGDPVNDGNLMEEGVSPAFRIG